MRALLVLALLATVAHADTVDPEVSASAVRGELRGTTAVFRAHYAVKLRGPTYAWGTTALLIPEGAAATSVVVHAPDGAHRLALVDAEQAKHRFEAINKTHGGKRWAVLVEAHRSSVDVSFAAPHSATISIEMELQMPTCFDREVRYAQVPVTWKPVLAPQLQRRAGRALDLGRCRQADDETEELWVAFPSAELARKPLGGDRVGAHAARIDVGDTHIARLELAIARTISEVPRDLATAILVDTSRSMTTVQLEAQRELVKAYARAAGETRLQVIAYARTARALLPSWMTARTAIGRLDRELRALAPRNGSNIDVALVEAGRWLDKTAGTRRVVLITDERLSRRLHARFEALHRLLPPNTLLHLVRVDEHSGLDRQRGFGERLAEATGGMAVRAGIPDDGTLLDATQLVRPLRIDQLAITAPGWKRFSQTLHTTCADELGEGQSCVWWGEGDAVAGPVAVEGKLWGKRFTRIVTPGGGHTAELARELSQMRVLDERAFTRAQRLSRAASSAWSFYGEWGRPGGYDLGGISIRGSSSCCGHRSATAPHVTIGRAGPGRELPIVDLSPQFAHVVARCGLGDAHVEATIELTEAEIVEVTVLAPPPVARCVEDEIWDTAVTPPPLARTSSRIVLVH